MMFAFFSSVISLHEILTFFWYKGIMAFLTMYPYCVFFDKL